MNLTYIGSIGCDVWYNSAIVLLRINRTNLSLSNGSKDTGLVLPDNITPKMTIYITTPVLTSSWRPAGEIAYIVFEEGDKNPNMRFVSNSVSGAVIQGVFAFPRGYFNIE